MMKYLLLKILFIKNKYTVMHKGLTLVEMIIALSLMTIVFASVVPMFSQMRNSWDSRQAAAETMQNGRILMEHIQRNLSKAVKVVAVSDASETDGYIEFENNDAEMLRYDISGTDGYVKFGQVGNLSELAGPVGKLQFRCYDAFDLDNPLSPVTDANSIRVIEVETILTNSLSSQQDKTLTTWAYLRTNANSESGLEGWWEMDESSGTTAADSSGNGNNGSLMNMVGTEWTGGVIGGALNFDGSNDYIAIQNLYYDGSGFEEVTVAAWIRTSDSGNQIIASYDRNEYWRLEVNGSGGGSGQIGWDVRTSTGQVDYGSTTRVDDGQWHHVAGVFDNGTLIIYIDGNPESPASGGSTFGRGVMTRYGFLGVGSEASSFDGSKGPTNYFNGDMDDVRIYNCALSAEDISQLAEVLKFKEFSEEKVIYDDTSITISTPATNEGDLLVTAIATDGDTSSSLAPPGGENWTEIDIDDYSNDVTLGVWYKQAEASESSSHQFTWSGAEQAYGWMMRFTGHNPTNPLTTWSDYGENSSTPTSPAVTTTVSNSLILRLGAFDDSDITEDVPGLTDHIAITMDKSAGVIFEDGFETGFDKWTDGGSTDWDRSSSTYYSGNYSAWCDRWDNDLISDNINTSGYSSFNIEFRYRIDDIDNNDNVYLQLYNGSSYVNYDEIGDDQEDTWLYFQATITDSQYCRSNFRIKFEGSSIDNNENLWIDDVKVTASGVSGGAGYIMQSSTGSSGTSAFSLGSANEAKTLTIAIAPDNDSVDGYGEIRP